MVATYDSQPSVAGLDPSAEGTIPGYGVDVIPDGTDDAALDDAGQDDAEATEESDAPFDIDSLDEEQRVWLDGHYQTQYEAQFGQRLADAMRTRDRENNSLREQKRSADSAIYAAQSALQQAHAWMANYAKQQGDDLAYYQFRDATGGAIQQATMQSQQANQNLYAYIVQQESGSQQELETDSIGLNGQRLFDPNDTDLQNARTTYLQAAYRDQSQRRPDGSYDVVANQTAKAAWDSFQTMKRAKMLGGVNFQAAADKQAKAKEAAAAKARRAARGPQATGRGSGSGGPMSPDQAAEIARKEFPNDGDKYNARYLSLRYPQQ